MKKYGIPTAEYQTFSDADSAKAYIREKGAPIVVKADGLALGKGVTVAIDLETALEAVDAMMTDRKFGDSGGRVVIEEYMTGPEVTVLAFTDGKTVVPMLSSQDHKRAFTGDLGPNTGGMGAFCPSPKYTDDLADICMKTIFRPTIDAMVNEGRVFKGVLYFGLMLTPAGPRVIEYNSRFGDPEAQAVLSMLKTDLLDVFEAVADERLGEIDIEWRGGYSCCVVMASGGYPEKYDKGFPITGLNEVPDDITVFHAGTAKSGAGVVTNGGRILGVTATGDSLSSAAKRAYDGVGLISFEKAYFRADIGLFG
jgi:phosphoribosylamine--glycine ligase